MLMSVTNRTMSRWHGRGRGVLTAPRGDVRRLPDGSSRKELDKDRHSVPRLGGTMLESKRPLARSKSFLSVAALPAR